MKTKLASAIALGIAIGMAFTHFAGKSVAAQENEDETFHMLNVLWFKEDGGAEKYAEYMAAAGPIVAKYGAKGGTAYVPEQAMIGEFDADLFFVVEWPNQKAFETFIQDPDYQAVSHLRGEAITDSLLIRCKVLAP